MLFKTFFNKESTVNASRDKFLSRFMGLFSEEIIEIWCRDQKSSYENLGRPTLRERKSANKEASIIYSTLDFTLKKKRGENKGKIYVAESKCLLQFQNYGHIELNDIRQIQRLNKDSKRAFQWLLRLSKPREFILNYKSKENKIQKDVAYNGGILIWASINKECMEVIKEETKLSDILSLEKMIAQLIEWNNQEYNALLNQKSKWVKGFISFLSQAEHR